MTQKFSKALIHINNLPLTNIPKSTAGMEKHSFICFSFEVILEEVFTGFLWKDLRPYL